MKKRNFIVVLHWHGYIDRIDGNTAYCVVKENPLDKKKARKHFDPDDGTISLEINMLPEKDKCQVLIGRIFDIYVGWKYDKHKKRFGDVIIVFPNIRKRPNWRKINKKVDQWMEKLKFN